MRRRLQGPRPHKAPPPGLKKEKNNKLHTHYSIWADNAGSILVRAVLIDVGYWSDISQKMDIQLYRAKSKIDRNAPIKALHYSDSWSLFFGDF